MSPLNQSAHFSILVSTNQKIFMIFIRPLFEALDYAFKVKKNIIILSFLKFFYCFFYWGTDLISLILISWFWGFCAIFYSFF